MNLKRLRRSIIALWFGVFTLAVSGVEQNQLAANVMVAATTDAGVSVGSTIHPADCPMHNAGGHTHKGHADCAICGSLAALTAVTLSAAVVPLAPPELADASPIDIPRTSVLDLRPSPYSSRAPPSVI
ncbi:MAG: DUF2946 domain-containing protein [Rhodospirillaceae bacterium]|nr:MAG: DUF2946 domain-containing protein [Rhodospirillaceae bacterium]